MALLGGGRTGGRRLRRALLLLGVLGLAGCFLLEASDGDGRPAFSHDVHVVQQSMSCIVCHRAPEGQDRPAMPPADLCRICHTGPGPEGEPAESYAARLAAPHDPHRRVGRLPLGAEIVFSHDAHAERADDCSRCHRSFDRAPGAAGDLHLAMDDCTSCHTTAHASNACATCHREIDVDWAPDSHRQAWIERHGEAFRNRTAAIGDRCDMCHTESTCVQCHRSEKPKSHTNTFRLRTHGFEAAFDRQGCQTCHTDDSCARCHAVIEPLSHVGPWGQPQNTHCLSCHFPLGNESCVVCHKGTPSHGDATPMPPWHDPAFNCRLCHGAGADLPHVDDGSSCTLCHK